MDLLGTLDPTTAIILLGMVAGVIELIKRAFDKDWRAVAIIAAAGVVGGASAFALGIGVLIGIAVGFATSGYVTIAQNFGSDA